MIGDQSGAQGTLVSVGIPRNVREAGGRCPILTTNIDHYTKYYAQVPLYVVC